MEYNQIFRPDTLSKLNKRSQENLKKLMGDKTLMQTMMSSTRLLQEIMVIEAPYKDQLEQLAVQMVEDMYPIITEDGINIDAKIVSMSDVNKSLDEIKLKENSPEAKRRVINGISQGAALHGTFSFYMFKEYLDVIDDTLVEKYNQLMKEVFGVYDDDNAIAMFLQMIAQGQKMGGGSSKVVINEIKINKPTKIFVINNDDDRKNFKKIAIKNNWINYTGDMASDFYYPDGSKLYLNKDGYIDIVKNNINEIKIDKPIKTWDFKFIPKEGERIKIPLWYLKDDIFIGSGGDAVTNEKNQNRYSLTSIRRMKELDGTRKTLNEQQGPTIQARAICFPMLVHEIIKGLYELVSLQGFSGTKDQNQAVVDKVDKLENEPHDLKYGKYIYDALNNIYAESGYDDSRIREFFFAEVYQLGDQEFVDFVENALNDELTSSQQSWIKQILKEIQMDLRSDDFDQSGIE